MMIEQIPPDELRTDSATMGTGANTDRDAVRETMEFVRRKYDDLLRRPAGRKVDSDRA